MGEDAIPQKPEDPTDEDAGADVRGGSAPKLPRRAPTGRIRWDRHQAAARLLRRTGR